MNGIVFNVQKFSLHDGPGIRTTVFVKGCPLRCKWCANPESQNPSIEFFRDPQKCTQCGTCLEVYPDLFTSSTTKLTQPLKEIVSVCPNEALFYEGEEKSVEEIVKTCLQDMPFYEESGGGVTLSGGEALVQAEFTEALIDALKEHSIPVDIETTGAVANETFRKLAPKFDLLLYDMKHYDSKMHKKGTGVANEHIIENLKWVIENELPHLVRIPVIPGFNDQIEDAKGFVKLFEDIGVDRVQLLPFHQFGEKKYSELGREYAYSQQKAFYPEDLEDYRQIFLENGIEAFF